MDADAIGGSINLVTKNSPYKRTLTATAGSGYNWISEKAQLNLGLTYGDRFFNDKLGVMLSASYQNRPIGFLRYRVSLGERRQRKRIYQRLPNTPVLCNP